MNAAAIDELDVRVRNLFLSAREAGVKLAAKSIAKSREVVDAKSRSLASLAERLGAYHDQLVNGGEAANENAAAPEAQQPPSRL